PDLAPLVPFAEAPIEKPPITVLDLPLPPSPSDLPAMPLAAIVVPVGPKPTAPIPPPGTLACVGATFGIVSKALECGRAHYAKGEYDDAVQDLEAAVRRGKERDLLTEARYWLAETYYRLDRFPQADALFRQVARGPRTAEFTVWSLHSSGWTALRVNDILRARDTFAQFQSATPAELEAWARHGLGLASYALGRHDDAVAAWTALAARPPASLARDVSFWLGEALGRVGQYDRSIRTLTQFVQGGPHPLLDAGRARLGWWSLAAERYPDSVTAFRSYITSPRGNGPERPWVEAGLALALFPSDPDAARGMMRGLEGRRSPLVVPLQIRLTRAMLEAKKPAEVPALTQELLGATLTTSLRAHVLLLKGEGYRLAGNRDEARTQYELSQRLEPASPTGWYAAYRLAQSNFELREYAQAARDLAAVVSAAPSPDARVAALLLRGEAAYYAGDHATAAAAFRRVLADVPGHAQAPAARLGLAWSLMRHDRLEDARREFLEFAQALPGDPRAPDALELASELALRKEADREEARKLLDRVITTFPSAPRTDFARLNRAILMLKMGDAAGAEAPLRDWIRRAPFPPLLGRAQTALGAALLAAGRPIEAATAFKRAEAEGVGPLAQLGLGATSLAERQWAQASGKLTEARDGGTAEIAAVAGYGLAVVAFQRGDAKELKEPARAALGAAPKARSAPRLLYVLTAIGVDEKDWPGALATAKRLATDFPADEAADDGLERVGAGAAAAGAWPTVIEAYGQMERLYPKSPFLEPARVTVAEALVETGKPEAARPVLEQFLSTSPNDPRAQRAWGALARARDAAGDRPGALEAYTRALKDTNPSDLRPEMALGYARLLAHEKRWQDARKLLEPLLRSDDKTVVASAAGGIGEAFQGEGENLAAAEYFMTAAYVAPDTPAGRSGLLGAGACFVALKQNDSAEIVYKKLIAQKDAPADVLEKARKGLKDIGR
ncbi:MAG: tetratricopeptide repeat protein, partial [Candidatus Rokuibacteriota bacterium]